MKRRRKPTEKPEAPKTPLVYVRWECPGCKLTCSQHIPENDMKCRRCPRCNAAMNEVHRGKAA